MMYVGPRNFIEIQRAVTDVLEELKFNPNSFNDEQATEGYAGMWWRLEKVAKKVMKITMMKEVQFCFGHQDYKVGELNT